VKKVLFVCVENSCRSQMAEGFARLHGAGVLDARSAGSKPSGVVNPKAIAAMKERGVDIAGNRSKSLSSLRDETWDYAITMGCGDACPFVAARRREDWAIPDPKSLEPDEFAKVRNLIEARVKALVAEAR
jgi:protein-tyrosine-phosphatase